ncbi:MAG: hypothetical protein J4F46_04565 [Dehalococcoidia bacterium]|nr:hypothetical protein [Dehalococcoidia bacterium]
MVTVNPKGSQEELSRELIARAAEILGQERAEAIRATLSDAAANLLLVSQNLPHREEEPAFFL